MRSDCSLPSTWWPRCMQMLKHFSATARREATPAQPHNYQPALDMWPEKGAQALWRQRRPLQSFIPGGRASKTGGLPVGLAAPHPTKIW